MIKLTDKVWAEAIPADASPYILDSANGKGQGLFWTQPGVQSPPWIDLPPGTYRFLFTTKTATEDQARKVVRELPVGARYENYNGDYPVWYHTAKESQKSLLRSKGLDDKNNYALIENTTNGK